MPNFVSRPNAPLPVDPRLERALRRIVLCGLLAVLLLPAARGANFWIGALPLWLLAMPASAWWALHRFRLPSWSSAPIEPARRRRRSRAQARRRALPAVAAETRLRAA